MRPPTCCICMRCASASMPCWRARAAWSWRRPVSNFCRRGPSSICRAGTPRTSSPIPRAETAFETPRPGPAGFRPVSVTLVTRGPGCIIRRCRVEWRVDRAALRSSGEFGSESRLSSRNGGALCHRRAPQPDGAGAARRGPGGRDPGDGRDRRGVDLQSVPDAVAQAAARHRKPRRLRHQDHHGIAAYGRLHAPISGPTKSGRRPRPRT